MSFGVVACTTQQNIVRPPLDDPPQLGSVQTMENPKTKEPGFWMNRPDAEKVAAFFRHVLNVKHDWR